MAKYSDKQNKWTQEYIKKAYDEIIKNFGDEILDENLNMIKEEYVGNKNDI